MSTAAIATPTNQPSLVHALADEVAALKIDNAQLKQQLEWFKKQLFGTTSEKRMLDNPDQPLLAGLTGEPVPPLPPRKQQTVTYERGVGKNSAMTA